MHDKIESVFRLLDRAVWIVTSRHGLRGGGLAATWVMQASIDPARPVVAAAIGRNHFTAELIDGSRAFAAHLIRPDQIDLVWRFALGSGRDKDKLSGLDLITGSTGSPILADCLAWLDCRVTARHDSGDRIYFWGEVLSGDRRGDGPALTEQQLLSAATPEQKAALLAGLLADIEVQRCK